jgi:glycosyltransferase involved in cell wall biosynthesis
MRTLVASSSPTPVGVEDPIKAGHHPRIDYLELSNHLQADYVDSNRFQSDSPARWIENKLRMDFRQALWVAREVRNKHYDTVLLMSERLAIPISPLLPNSVKQVVIGHHLISPVKLRMIKMTKIHRKWDVIVAPTEAEASVLKVALKSERSRVEGIHFSIDTKFFKPDPNFTPPSIAEHILSVGLSYRDYPTLIAALEKLPHIPCQLRVGSSWVAGKGGIERTDLPANVTIKPFVPLAELLRCYEDCRFVVIPVSRTTQWSAGSISVLLAQAMGKPIIVSKTPGMPDYVLNGETGILVEMSSPEAMADAIDYLWNRPDLAVGMGKRAQEWVTETFSIDRWVVSISGIVRSLANDENR